MSVAVLALVLFVRRVDNDDADAALARVDVVLLVRRVDDDDDAAAAAAAAVSVASDTSPILFVRLMYS